MKRILEQAQLAMDAAAYMVLGLLLLYAALKIYEKALTAALSLIGVHDAIWEHMWRNRRKVQRKWYARWLNAGK